MVQLGRRALDMPGDARQDLWIIQQLANRLGCGWNYQGPESGVAEVYEEMRQAMNTISGITWERLQEQSSVTYPCRTEDDPGQPVVFTENFPTKDGRGKFVPADIIPANERPDAEYPVRAHHRPAARALAHRLDDAPRLGARRARAAGGRVDASARPRRARRQGRRRDHRDLAPRRDRAHRARRRRHRRAARIFIPFAFYEAAANVLTNAALDPFGKIAEVKYCAVKVSAGGELEALASYGGGQSFPRRSKRPRRLW